MSEPGEPQAVRIAGLPSGSPAVPAVAYEDLPEPLRSELAPRVRRLGYLGAFFSVLGHQPEALRDFHRFTEDLKTAVPDNLTEIVALTVATLLDNEYERVQHVRLATVQGHDAAWIAEASAADGSVALSPEESAVRDLARHLVDRRGRDARTRLDVVVELVGPRVAVGVVLLVARYVAHAHVANAFELVSPVDAPAVSRPDGT
jgi:hypothetical protein